MAALGFDSHPRMATPQCIERADPSYVGRAIVFTVWVRHFCPVTHVLVIRELTFRGLSD
jgi:hypothetical protein